jgi:polysaccharide biosynthesis transport protein
MEADINSLQDYIRIFKRFKNQISWITLSIFLLAIVIALALPAIYKSTAKILIEQQEIPEELVRSTITSFADQRIQVISQRVMNSENMTAIINKFNLFEKERKVETTAAILDKLRDDIKLDMISADVVDPRSGRPTQATIAFALSFTSQSPSMAQQVANELVNLYLNENVKHRTQAVSETNDFLAIEADKLRSHISELESALADFKEKNSTSLPELQQLNLQLMDRNEQQINEIDKQLASLQERKIYLQSELAQISPILESFSASGARIFSSGDRLKALQSEYIALTAKYSANHPDVLKARKEIAALQNELGGVDKAEITKQLLDKKGELTQLSEKYSADHPDVKRLTLTISRLEAELQAVPRKKPKNVAEKPDNPAYIQLQAQLQSANSEINALQQSKKSIKSKIADYEKSLRASPQVERKYHDLNLDYDNSMMKYREVKAKQMEADMSKTMEADRKGERFSLIEPPIYPEKPLKPNRSLIVLLGLFIALLSGFGYALLRASIDPGIYGINDLKAITGAAPLIVIPFLYSEEELTKKSHVKWWLVATPMVLLVIALVIIHFAYAPLDVLWYALQRKLGITIV